MGQHNIDAFRVWNKKVGNIIDAIGTDNFLGILSQAIQHIVPNLSFILFVIRENEPPRALFDNYPKHLRAINTDEYSSGAYLLDPFRIKYREEGSKTGLYRLTDVAPEGFLESEYYRLFYCRSQCIDEVSYTVQINDDVGVSLSVARTEANAPFTQKEMADLHLIKPVVISSLRNHFHREAFAANEKQSKVHNQLKVGLEYFGTSVLSAREQGIMQLILRGHSSKSIARELSISLDTVKMHRKNAYTKLDVSSQAELFSLVFSTLSSVNLSPNNDPLQAYLAG